MQIGTWKSAPEVCANFREIRKLGLESHIAELETFGFTIVEPDKAAPKEFFDRMLAAIRRICAEENPETVAMANRPQAERPVHGRSIFNLIRKDPIFAEAAVNPVGLALAKHMMGASCHIWNTAALVKEGLAGCTKMHTDSMGVPTPLPPWGTICNVSFILTDYTKEKGTFAMVPSSHRWCRHPTEVDQPKFMDGPADDELYIPVEAPSGSLIVFHGNTWHGTFPKTDEAVRSHVAFMYARNYVQPAQTTEEIPQETLDRFSPELARLVGHSSWQGYGDEGPKLERLGEARGMQRGVFS